ncbi:MULTISPECIES: hypothetical protein [Nitratireductor]|uniref:hypothetical protein n=1 Tax=Nitratireductor TaxID=245876 RepID=UPI000D0E0712|nr:MULTISPECIES: hypothetical protein [Nitratireductor]PSM18115.1 hypothetical protein C7T96_09540 [Nitratireductor sp. StC3]
MNDVIARLPAALAAGARLALLAAALCVPLLAMPAKGGNEAILVGGDINATSGAGLVIVVGLRRAR